MDFDDINIAGLIFALIAFGVGIIVANSMKAGLFLKLGTAVVCAIVGYFVGGKIAEN